MTNRFLTASSRPGVKLFASLLVMALVIGLFPLPPASYAAYDEAKYAIASKEGAEEDVEKGLANGQVWAGKSVDADRPEDKFKVELSVLGRGYPTSGEIPPDPVNVVLVLDASTSMDSNGKLNTMIDATNELVTKIHELSPENKVAIVTFDSSARKLVDLRKSNQPFTILKSGTANNTTTFRIPTVAATNIQAGMNVGYWVLQDAKAAGDVAKPIMVVLSDGATWYHNINVTAPVKPTNEYGSPGNSAAGWRSESGGQSASGISNNGLGLDSARYTIQQAYQLKQLMTELEIYTVGYDIAADSQRLPRATLNPTEANIAAVTGGTSEDLYQRLAKPDRSFSNAADAAAVYNYPTDYFPSNANLDNLKKAFGEIANSFNNTNPLYVNPNAAVDSLVTVTDTIGAGFEISGDLTMKLKGNTTHTFVKDSVSGAYESATAPAGVSVKLEGNQLIWEFPATELPENVYSDDESPISNPKAATLSFDVELADGAVDEKTYYTNYAEDGETGGAWATFTPAENNPYYYDEEGEVIDEDLVIDGKVTLNMPNSGEIVLEKVTTPDPDEPSIEVTKVGTPGSVLVGEEVEYTITITNDGDTPLNLVSVTDSFLDSSDIGYTIISGIEYKINEGDAVAVTSDNGIIAFENPIPLAIEDKVTITYTVKFLVAGPHTNTVNVLAKYENEDVPGDDECTVIVEEPKVPGLEVNKTIADGEEQVKLLEIESGDTVKYQIIVSNTGNTPLSGQLILEDEMFNDDDFDLIDLELLDENGDPTGTQLTWGRLDGEVVDLNKIYIEPKEEQGLPEVRLALGSAPVIEEDSLEAEDETGDEDAVNDEEEGNVNNGGDAEINDDSEGNVSEDSEGEANDDSEGNVSSDGDADVDKEVKSSPKSGARTFVLAVEEEVDLWFEPGMSVRLTYTRAMFEDHDNTVTATMGNLTDDSTAHVKIKKSEVDDKPDIKITKSVVGSSTITGTRGTFTYKLVIKNIGDKDLYNVSVKDVFAGSPDVTYKTEGLPEGVEFDKETGVFSGLGDLAVGKTIEITYKVDIVGRDTYKNTATVTATDEQEKEVTASDSATVRIEKGGGGTTTTTTGGGGGEEPTGVLPEVDKPEEDTGVAAEVDKLPQTGGISTTSLFGLFGLLLAAGGGTAYIKLRRRSLAKASN